MINKLDPEPDWLEIKQKVNELVDVVNSMSKVTSTQRIIGSARPKRTIASAAKRIAQNKHPGI